MREEVLGDLGEEFDRRARLHGPRAARRWYRREVLRSCPSLLHDTWRRLGARALAVVGVASLWTYAIVFSLVIAVNRGISRALLPTHVEPGCHHFEWYATGAALVIGLALGAFVSRRPVEMLARAPIAVAVAGLVIATRGLLAASSAPLWFQLLLHSAVLAGATCAAALRLVRRASA